MDNVNFLINHSPQEDLFIEVNKYLEICNGEDRKELISELKLDYKLNDIYHMSDFDKLNDFEAFEFFREIKQKQYYKMGYFEE